MRIAGNIEHPVYKITILHMNHRYAVKFEHGGLEQTYKIRESESISNVAEIQALVEKQILDDVDQIFQKMEGTRIKMLLKGDATEEEFEEII